MLKKVVFVLSVLFSTQAFAFNLPTEFTVTERWLSWTTTFDIENNQQKFGTVNRKLLSWSPQYHLKDTNDELLAKGKMRFWNLLAFFDVTDAAGTPLGTLEQKLTWFFPTFEIVSPRGFKLAKAELNFWGTKYTLSDVVDDHTLATMTRPFFRLKNNWTVNILDTDALNENNLHPHMLLVMLAYQVDREYWKAARRNRDYEDADDLLGAAESHRLSTVFAANTLRAAETKMPQRPEAANELCSMLELFTGVVEAAEPTEEDFSFVESLVNENIADEAEFISKAKELFILFESNDLTDGQKAALYLMLKNRLEH